MPNMLQALHDHPGLYFVAATFAPLASFVLLLLAGGIRWALRPHRNSTYGPPLYRMLGGDVPGRGPAYVATAAMALAFVFSAIGAVQFFAEEAHLHGQHHESNGHHHDDHAKIAGHKDDHRTHAEALKQHADRWSGHVSWASLTWLPKIHAVSSAIPVPDHALELTVGYQVDSLTVIMFLMVTFIATLIHIFSMGYMQEELAAEVEDHHVHAADGHYKRRGRFGRFFLFLSLFCFSMLNLVLADNLFQVFVSWELVGICSYLLIGFYYERPSASNAANKAFITNRVGDAGFILGLLVLWTYVGTLNFDQIFQQIRAPATDAHHHPLPMAHQFVRCEIEKTEDASHLILTEKGSQVLLFPLGSHIHAHDFEPGEKIELGDHFRVEDRPGRNRNLKSHDFVGGTMPYWLLVVAGLGIFLGCVGKSAQFPLHVWLPDAMEGPTPVSALIHAATMVAAGVYLVGRCFPLFTPEARLVIAYTGAVTLFVAATIAIVMTDIKKVLAYSTVSQLGFMMLALGVGGWMAGLFHLVTHAFFKALLFLGSGSVIYGCHHEQEMTKMGGLYSKMRITALTMLIGVLTIAGMPLFSGWYSKDAIIAQALGFVVVNREHALLLVLPVVTAGITTFYMFRMWFMTFTGDPRDPHVYEHAHESPRLMTVPLIVLAGCSVAVAWGWPLHEAEASLLGQKLHHAQPGPVYVEFGVHREADSHLEHLMPGVEFKNPSMSERYWAHHYHLLAELLALTAAGLGCLFAALIYYYRVFDSAEAKEKFASLHAFLGRKWYFDELYSAILVRPALAVAHWCRAFDAHVIDRFIDWLGSFTVRLSRWDGLFDKYVVDGLVNVTADTVYAVGARIRGIQTGSLRGYIMFLVVAVVGIFAVLSYFATLVSAG
jgi:NADH-quinone oxidoreductase subunit L